MIRNLCLSLLLTAAASLGAANTARAYDPFSYGGRQYYSSWSYNPQTEYYYSSYYYRPSVHLVTYQYHYAIHYPAQPRYVYYYNPHRHVYWGRFDLEGTEGEQYSILADKDRKEKLSDIPEEAFPKPATMPKIPESKDDEPMLPLTIIPGNDIPEAVDKSAE